MAGLVTPPTAGSLAASPPESTKVSTTTRKLVTSAPARILAEFRHRPSNCEPTSSINVCSLNREYDYSVSDYLAANGDCARLNSYSCCSVLSRDSGRLAHLKV